MWLVRRRRCGPLTTATAKEELQERALASSAAMPKKNKKKKGGDYDDYDDMLADPVPTPVADGGADDEFGGMAKKSKKKGKKGAASAAPAAVAYSFGDAKKKPRAKVILRKRTRVAEFYEGIRSLGPSPAELVTVDPIVEFP